MSIALSQIKAATKAKSIQLEIAGVSVRLIPDDPALTLTIEGAAREFLINDCTPDIELTAAWGSVEEPRAPLLFDSGAVWKLFDINGDRLFSFNSPTLGTDPYKLAILNPEFTRGHVILNSNSFEKGAAIYPLEYPLDELIVLNWLALGRGVEMHSCGLIDSDGRGRLFAGQSGAGKTTTARLWENIDGVKILSDDRIILRKIGEEIWMHGTPWHGDAELASPAKARLDHIYFIKHGPENRLAELSKANAIARLFACSFPPFHSSEGLDFTLGFMSEVVASVHCAELTFTPTREAVDFINGMIE
ncbi:MAG: hypothetical protein DMF61_13150 [Blastocatellia bacterium AA13]|nr:MAG: hypothetical protein DMF61_13150 [Blastocatellia bacterium AA13]